MEINKISSTSFGTRKPCHLPRTDSQMFRKFRSMVARQNGGQCPDPLIGHVVIEGRPATMYIGRTGVSVEPPSMKKTAIAKFRDNFFEYCTKGKYFPDKKIRK